MNFTLRLLEYRQRNNLSQCDIAQILGVSLRSVSRWESGASPPDTKAQHYMNILNNTCVVPVSKTTDKRPIRADARMILWTDDQGTALMQRNLKTLDWIIDTLPVCKYITITEPSKEDDMTKKKRSTKLYIITDSLLLKYFCIASSNYEALRSFDDECGLDPNDWGIHPDDYTISTVSTVEELRTLARDTEGFGLGEEYISLWLQKEMIDLIGTLGADNAKK